MKLYIASDHAGFVLKGILVEYLKGKGVDIIDKGPFELNPLDDYPDWISLAAKEVSADPTARAVVIGMSGQGEAIVANRYKNVRAGVFYGGPEDIVRLLREHNNSNILSLGAKFLSQDQAKAAVDLWLTTPFSEEARHSRRIAKIDPSA